MREVEVKGVTADLEAAASALARAGAVCVYEGSLVDRRYDTPSLTLRQRDEVLRIRVTRNAHGTEVRLDFKGPTTYPNGFKVREEWSTSVEDAETMHCILEGLGYQVSREIEREVRTYTLGAATVRFETYPRMDVLVEVEGEPDAIEAAIAAMGMPREAFTVERLSDFARRYEARTGTRAALSARELAGDYTYLLDDA
jgi:predicted adenylyl cyclase CyaB